MPSRCSVLSIIIEEVSVMGWKRARDIAQPVMSRLSRNKDVDLSNVTYDHSGKLTGTIKVKGLNGRVRDLSPCEAESVLMVIDQEGLGAVITEAMSLGACVKY